MFLVTFLYAIGFVAGFGVPKHIDNGIETGWAASLAINISCWACSPYNTA